MCIKEHEPRQKQGNYAAHLRRSTPAVNGSQTGPENHWGANKRSNDVWAKGPWGSPWSHMATRSSACRKSKFCFKLELTVMALVTPGALKKAFQPFLPASVAVVRISPSQRGSRSNSGQRRRGRRELEQHGTRGNTPTAGSTLKVTPTFCYTFGSAPSPTPLDEGEETAIRFSAARIHYSLFAAVLMQRASH